MRYRFRDHTLDTATLQLLAGSTEVELEPQAFSVLAHLVRHRDRVVAKEELLDEVWGSRFVSESALTTRIKQVRRALGDSGREQRVLRTYHGRGYRFVAPVEEAADAPVTAPAPAATDSAMPAATATSATGTAAPAPRPPRTRYAESDGATIAYQTFGEGPDLAVVAGFATNVEAQWDHPAMADVLTRLGRIARVTVLDKRGVGLSDRLPHDSAPPLETRADDLTAVLDAAGIARATVLGSSEGGSLSAVFAASHPERVDGLILHNTWVTGPEFPRAGRSDLDIVLERWGTGRIYRYVGPSLAAAPDGRELLARYERQSATPRAARHLLELIGEIDIAGILGAITVPTLVLHRAGDRVLPPAHGRRLAAGIPGARLVILDGEDHFLLSGDATPVLAAIEEFLAGAGTGAAAERERVLATVLFLEASDSPVTAPAATPPTVLDDGTTAAPASSERGRAAHRDRLTALAATEVARARGRLVGTRDDRDNGDAVVATFDGPGRAVRAAAAVRDAARPLGLAVRAGVHTAEIEVHGDAVSGAGVRIAARTAGAAHPGEVWVSRTVTDLVAGTGLRFESRGEHVFADVDTPWRLFAATV